MACVFVSVEMLYAVGEVTGVSVPDGAAMIDVGLI